MVGLGDEEGMYPVEELGSEEGTLLVVEVGGEEESSIDFVFVFILVCLCGYRDWRIESREKIKRKGRIRWWKVSYLILEQAWSFMHISLRFEGIFLRTPSIFWCSFCKTPL